MNLKIFFLWKCLIISVFEKILVVENVSRRIAVFNINIWAVHCMNSLVLIPEIRIFTNYFHQSGNFQESFSFGEKNLKIQNWGFVKSQKSGFRNSWNHVGRISIVSKIMIILFEKNGAKKKQYVQLIVLGIGWLF